MRKRFFVTALLLMAFAVMFIPKTADAAVFYTVQKGDTLWSISKEYGVSMESILQCNPDLKNEKHLKTGMALTIPDPSESAIPVDETVTETHTLIVHGSGNQYNPPSEQAVNTMTVNGKTIEVPAHQPVKVASAGNAYREKYHDMTSRSMGPNANASPTITGKCKAIIDTAYKYMGVPYVFGGSTPSGFDCSGFIQYVFRANGITTPRMAHHQYYAGTPISKSQLQPGDLVFFETYTVGISHVGIYIGNNKFIHASSRGGVRVNSLGQEYYTNRYRGAARYY